jgi:hypothetical protein
MSGSAEETSGGVSALSSSLVAPKERETGQESAIQSSATRLIVTGKKKMMTRTA